MDDVLHLLSELPLPEFGCRPLKLQADDEIHNSSHEDIKKKQEKKLHLISSVLLTPSPYMGEGCPNPSHQGRGSLRDYVS